MAITGPGPRNRVTINRKKTYGRIRRSTIHRLTENVYYTRTPTPPAERFDSNCVMSLRFGEPET